MEITREILIDRGIDPSLYSKKDLESIGDIADKIERGGLDEMLQGIAADIPNEKHLRDAAGEVRNEFNSLIESICERLDRLTEVCSTKKSIFAGEISVNESPLLLDKSADILLNVNVIREKALDRVLRMYRVATELSEIQLTYDRRLYNAGLINAAMTVMGRDTGGFYPMIESSFEKFNSITEFINDLTDRAVIGETAMEEKLPLAMDELCNAIDINGDGAAFSAQKTLNAAIAAKAMLKDVIER